MKPHVSKLCWIADVMTTARFVFAGVIFVGTMMGNLSPFAVLALFCTGEVFDALDGVWARNFLHPSWANKLPFRKYASFLDKAADLLLMGVTLLFILFRLKDRILVGGATVFAVLALVIELNKARLKKWSYDLVRDEDFAILLRRGVYVILVCLTAMRLGDAIAPYTTLTICLGTVSLFAAFSYMDKCRKAFYLGEVRRALLHLAVSVILVISIPAAVRIAYSMWWANLVFKMLASLTILIVIAQLKSDRASEENTPTPRAEDVQA